MRSRRLLPLFGGATAVFLCVASAATVRGADKDDPQASPSTAQSDNATSDTAAKEPAETTVTVGSVTVGVDPKTGDIRPLTAAEAARLAREMNRLFKPRELRRVQNPDGSLSAIVSPNVLRFSVARIEADGTVSRECAPSQETALEFLARTHPKPTASLEKPKASPEKEK
jgi:hypothetical protein